MRLIRVTAGVSDPLDRPGQMIVEAGQRRAVERAEAQHHALLVRLHAIDAAGEPQRHDGEADQREAAPAGEPPARDRRRAGSGCRPGAGR